MALVLSIIACDAPWISADRTVLPADGRSTARIRARGDARIGYDREAAKRLGVRILPAIDGSLIVRAGETAGRLDFVADNGRLALAIVPSRDDADEDGFPDAVELLTEESRAAFTAWFSAIAETQASRIDDAWPKAQQDCAGLVRFAMKEALRAHDPAWRSHHWAGRRPFSAPDVAAFRYPDLPFLGDRLFRVAPGPFDPLAPIEAQFSAFADARTLLTANTAFVSKSMEDARAGDLLFFAVPSGRTSRMHSMIVLGRKPGATHRAQGARVVYHTGSDERGEGEVRLVSFEALDRHPDPAWHPRPDNPRFLGVYRLAILDHAPARPALVARKEEVLGR